MFEMLLSMGHKETIPESGPGPKTLERGTRELGYFGTFSLDSFDMLDKLIALLLTPEDLVNWKDLQDNEWVKLSIDSKTYYTTRRPIGKGVSHINLFDSGMVYGDEKLVTYGFGDHPDTAQDAKLLVTEGDAEYVLIPRLVEAYTGFGVNFDLTDFPSSGSPTALTSEFQRVIQQLARTTDNGEDPLPAFGYSRMIAPAGSMENSANESRALAMDVLGLVKNAFNGQLSTNGTPTTAIPTTLSNKDVAWRPFIELAPDGTGKISELRAASYSNNNPLPVDLMLTDMGTTNQIIPVLLAPVVQPYKGPGITDMATAQSVRLVDENQSYVGPSINIF